jgi:hypothetical protein
VLEADGGSRRGSASLLPRNRRSQLQEVPNEVCRRIDASRSRKIVPRLKRSAVFKTFCERIYNNPFS